METMQIKVIIRDNIAEAILINQDIPVEVEIIDINKDYRDAEALDEYADSFYSNPEYKSYDYTTANFESDEEEYGDKISEVYVPDCKEEEEE